MIGTLCGHNFGICKQNAIWLRLAGFKQKVSASLRVGEGLGGFFEQINSIPEKVGGVGKLLGGFAIGEAVHHATEFATKLKDVAEASGFGTRFIQIFRFAVNQTSGTSEQATEALQKFNMKIGDARINGGATADAFGLLKVKLDDTKGAAKSNEQVFYETTDALHSISDASERARLVEELFGKGAKDLIPILSAGSEELKAFGDQAERLGLILDEKTIASFDRLDKSLKRSTERTEFFATKALGWAIERAEYAAKVYGALSASLDHVGKSSINAAAFLALLSGFPVLPVDFKALGDILKDAVKTADEASEAENKIADSADRRVGLEKQLSELKKGQVKSVEELAKAEANLEESRRSFFEKKEAPSRFTVKELSGLDERKVAPNLVNDILYARQIQRLEEQAKKFRDIGWIQSSEDARGRALAYRLNLKYALPSEIDPLRTEREKYDAGQNQVSEIRKAMAAQEATRAQIEGMMKATTQQADSGLGSPHSKEIVGHLKVIAKGVEQTAKNTAADKPARFGP